MRYNDRLRTMLVKLTDHFPMRVTEWLVAGILLSWGLFCINASPAVWDMPVNRELSMFGTQDQWGSVALSIGLVRMIALFINGAMRRSPHARAFGAFMSAFLWLQLSFGVLIQPFYSLSAIIYPWLFVADVYNVFRAARDARISDERARTHSGAARDARSA